MLQEQANSVTINRDNVYDQVLLCFWSLRRRIQPRIVLDMTINWDSLIITILCEAAQLSFGLYTVKLRSLEVVGTIFTSPNHPRCELNSHFG